MATPVSGGLMTAVPITHTLPSSQPSPLATTKKKREKYGAKSWVSIQSPLPPTVRAVENAEPRQRYSKAAAFHSSSPQFSLYRGFKYLHSRIPLDLQDEIAALEFELNQKDKEDFDEKNHRLLASRRMDIRSSQGKIYKNNIAVQTRSKERRELITNLANKLAVYDDLLLKAKDVAALKKPINSDFLSVRNFYQNEKPLIEAEEKASIRQKEDIISIYQGRNEATFDRVVVKLLEHFEWIRYLLSGPELRSKTKSKEIKLYSPHRVEILIGTLLAPILSGLLALPIATLYLLNISSDSSAVGKSIAVLIGFTLLFAGSMPVLTRAGRNEVFAASAAYCAVLVVFISNFSTNRNSKEN